MDDLDLIYAAQDNDLNSCLFLLQNSHCNVDLQNVFGFSALMYSILNQNLDLTSILISQYSANTQLFYRQSLTPFIKDQIPSLNSVFLSPQSNYLSSIPTSLLLAILNQDISTIQLLLQLSSRNSYLSTFTSQPLSLSSSIYRPLQRLFTPPSLSNFSTPHLISSSQILSSFHFVYDSIFNSELPASFKSKNQFLILDTLSQYVPPSLLSTFQVNIYYCAQYNMVNYFSLQPPSYSDLNSPLPPLDYSPLQYSVFFGNFEISQIFIQLGANTNFIPPISPDNPFNFSPLQLSLSLGFKGLAHQNDPLLFAVVQQQYQLQFDKISTLLLSNFAKPFAPSHYSFLQQHIPTIFDHTLLFQFKSAYFDSRVHHLLNKQIEISISSLNNYTLLLQIQQSSKDPFVSSLVNKKITQKNLFIAFLCSKHFLQLS